MVRQNRLRSKGQNRQKNKTKPALYPGKQTHTETKGARKTLPDELKNVEGLGIMDAFGIEIHKGRVLHVS